MTFVSYTSRALVKLLIKIQEVCPDISSGITQIDNVNYRLVGEAAGLDHLGYFDDELSTCLIDLGFTLPVYRHHIVVDQTYFQDRLTATIFCLGIPRVDDDTLSILAPLAGKDFIFRHSSKKVLDAIAKKLRASHIPCELKKYNTRINSQK